MREYLIILYAHTISNEFPVGAILRHKLALAILKLLVHLSQGLMMKYDGLSTGNRIFVISLRTLVTFVRP